MPLSPPSHIWWWGCSWHHMSPELSHLGPPPKRDTEIIELMLHDDQRKNPENICADSLGCRNAIRKSQQTWNFFGSGFQLCVFFFCPSRDKNNKVPESLKGYEKTLPNQAQVKILHEPRKLRKPKGIASTATGQEERELKNDPKFCATELEGKTLKKSMELEDRNETGHCTECTVTTELESLKENFREQKGGKWGREREMHYCRKETLLILRGIL
ncbi:hypothetical protein DFH08DRAFT_822176 [Mycena albidolilacea]|uniref:Uncharacterized protein n=1 Tax=Mycena albidolilacea TaxID=1033008 RepID=A0AAD6Z8L3_9AGAR|nr:hypothetical protein DFH08DRAFT_822176 [Mycena albidolilacea]